MVKTIILHFISKEKITQIVRKFNFIKNYTSFFSNYWTDMKLYYKYSSIYKIDDYKKIEAKIILHYHSIEKGLIHNPIRPKFAKDKIKELHKWLKHQSVVDFYSNSQIQVTFKILKQYYELHEQLKVDISDYFPNSLYILYCKLINTNETNFSGSIEFDKKTFYMNTDSAFDKFSNSRKSIRNFTGELISEDLIELAITLSLNSPSVCNRQSSKVYLVDDYQKIQNILKIQGGFAGFSDNVKQLLIVTSSRSYFYTLGERNQFYIDGGIYLMNLLYCLHYYKIANCPANWGKTTDSEKRLSKIIQLPPEEKIICLIPIGIATAQFKVPKSQRRERKEIYRKL
ncbi:nitroreductase family protein [Arenibacter certesii]|uniref:Nitroreductase domain-containing protein n=1 Tax=Arenibacter certesii TaxID=228955 RepID=A0A918MH83_9FLAO|nr:nitroreductase family protein [Arenibacter certesii]GGW22047.1 hypothetical protein GCM10007383_01320 [Arenibacter certesii]